MAASSDGPSAVVDAVALQQIGSNVGSISMVSSDVDSAASTLMLGADSDSDGPPPSDSDGPPPLIDEASFPDDVLPPTPATDSESSDDEIPWEPPVVQDLGHKRRRLTREAPPEWISREPKKPLEHFAQSRGMSLPAFQRLLVFGVPMVFLNILWWVHQAQPVASKQLDLVENFAGIGVLHSTFQYHGYRSVQLDVLNHESFENILTPEGYASTVWFNMMLRRGALSHWATVCSSWVCICKGTTLRTLGNPLGNTNIKIVREGNTMAARMCLVIFSWWQLACIGCWSSLLHLP